VQGDNSVAAEASPHARFELRRQPDLRNQHQHLAAGGQDRRHGMQIDLGLAATGDAVQQPSPKLPRLNAELANRGELLGGQRRRGFGWRTRVRSGDSGCGLLCPAAQDELLECALFRRGLGVHASCVVRLLQ